MSFLSISVAFLASALLVWWFSRPESRLRILDLPNERSLHTRPVSRTGGIGIMTGVSAGVLTLVAFDGVPAPLVWMLAGLIGIALVSVIDDCSHLPAGIRLGVHFVAAGLCVAGGSYASGLELPGIVLDVPIALGLGLSILFVVWMTNLYNFMDGMDGFAGGMSVLGFGGLGLFGLWGGDAYFATVALITAAAVAGFLCFNMPPARIFMGDVGSAGLGFLAAGLLLWGAQRELFPLWAGVLLFGPFVVDATVTLIRRLLRGERVWQAHRSHYYQRVVQLGWGHRRTVLWEYGLMLLSLFAALAAVRSSTIVQWIIILGVVAVYVGAMLWVDGRAPLCSGLAKSATMRG